MSDPLDPFNAQVASVTEQIRWSDATLTRLRQGAMTPAQITALGYSDAPSAIIALQTAIGTLRAQLDTLNGLSISGKISSGATYAAGLSADLATRTASTATLNAQAITAADAVDAALVALASALTTYEGLGQQIRALRVVSNDAVSLSIDVSATSAAVYAAGMQRFFAFMGTPGNATLGSRARAYLKL